jgi:WD40 repeat protein
LETATGKELVSFAGAKDHTFRAVAVSPDGKTLAGAGGKGVTLWDIGQRKVVATLPSDSPVSLDFSPDGKLLDTTDANNIEIWDLKTRSAKLSLKKSPRVTAAAAQPRRTGAVPIPGLQQIGLIGYGPALSRPSPPCNTQ